MKTLMLSVALGLASFGANAELNKLEQGIINACNEVGAQNVDLCVSNTKLFIGLAYKSGHTIGICYDPKDEYIKQACTPDIYANEDMNNFQDIADNMLAQ